MPVEVGRLGRPRHAERESQHALPHSQYRLCLWFQVRGASRAPECDVFVLPYRSVPFAVAFRAACSVSAHPVAALHQQDICVLGIPHVVHADNTQGIVFLPDRFETGELACVGRLPAHWGVTAYRSPEDVPLGLPLALACARWQRVVGARRHQSVLSLSRCA